jgi:two-component system cell cycle sensor histidine kinase/response regulator CckA
VGVFRCPARHEFVVNPVTADRLTSTAHLRGSETILVAEDEDGVRRIARRILEMYGYHVLEARHGSEALTLSEQHPGTIHLLLTDAIMPHMGGPELAVRLTQARRDIKVLFTSGYTDDVIARHGVLNEGAPFLQKPYSPQGLVEKVREVLA